MPRYVRFVSLLACSLAMTLVLAGCFGTNSNPTQSPTTPKVLTYAIGTDITSLDPVRQAENNQRLISVQVMETLVAYDENLKLVPLLAESWEPLNGGQQWRFKLRDNVFFHDDPCFQGKPRKVVASDVVYSLQRMLDPKTKTLGAYTLTDLVEGAAPFADGKATTVPGIVAENDNSVLIKLIKPYGQFPARMSLAFTAVTPKEAVDFYKDQWGTKLVGTGPFKLKSWDVARGEIALERNPKYWQSTTSNLTDVTFKTIKSDAAQLTGFSQGQIDVIEVSPTLAPQVFGQDGKPTGQFAEAQVKRSANLLINFVGFNLKRPVVQDKNFRLAINYAIDKEKLIQTVLNGVAKPANGPLSPGISGADDQSIYRQDIAKARELLKASPYKGQELAYITDNSATSVAVSEFLQAQLAAIGVKLRIDKNPESVWIDKLVKGQFDLAKVYFGFDYPSADSSFSQFVTANFPPQGNNFYYYSNPKFDALYAESLKQTDPAKAEALFQQMNQIIRDDVPWAFLYSPERVLAIRKDMAGVKTNPLSFSLILNDAVKS